MQVTSDQRAIEFYQHPIDFYQNPVDFRHNPIDFSQKPIELGHKPWRLPSRCHGGIAQQLVSRTLLRTAVVKRGGRVEVDAEGGQEVRRGFFAQQVSSWTGRRWRATLGRAGERAAEAAKCIAMSGGVSCGRAQIGRWAQGDGEYAAPWEWGGHGR